MNYWHFQFRPINFSSLHSLQNISWLFILFVCVPTLLFFLFFSTEKLKTRKNLHTFWFKKESRHILRCVMWEISADILRCWMRSWEAWKISKQSNRMFVQFAYDKQSSLRHTYIFSMQLYKIVCIFKWPESNENIQKLILISVVLERIVFEMRNCVWTSPKIVFLFWKMCVLFEQFPFSRVFSFISRLTFAGGYSHQTIIMILPSRTWIDNIFMLPPWSRRNMKVKEAAANKRRERENWGRKSIFVYLISEIRPAWKLLCRSQLLCSLRLWFYTLFLWKFSINFRGREKSRRKNFPKNTLDKHFNDLTL